MSPPTSPSPRAVTVGSWCTARALGHIPCSGWCAVFPHYSPLFHTTPVTCPSWTMVWVWPVLFTQAQIIFHFESTFWRYRHPRVSWSVTQSSLVRIPKIVPPRSLPCSRTWPVVRWVLCSSQKNLPSERCSSYRILFLFCSCPTASSPSSSRQTSPFYRAFNL